MLTMIWNILLLIQLVFTALSIKRWFKYRKEASTWYQEELEAWTKNQTEVAIPKMMDEFKANYAERVDLLSKENAKLIEKNELYRDKLKNLGFTDVSLDH